MELIRLLEKTEFQLIKGDIHSKVSAIVFDSRKAAPGCLFVCIAGTVSDGHRYIQDVIAKGASVILVQEDHIGGWEEEAEEEEGYEIPDGVALVSAPDTRKALAAVSAVWFDYPSEKIRVIGITGTKGKTTTTYMVKSILDSAGIPSGLIGTIEILTGKRQIPASHTTPESYLVQQYLAEMVEAGMKACVMEVSSQALKMNRTAGISFELGVFTNLSEDHIGPNEHEDFEDYRHCKSLLFSQSREAIVNLDDENAPYMMNAAACPVRTYGIDSERADIRAVSITPFREGGKLGVVFETEGDIHFPVKLYLPGRFSVYNALTAISICRHFGVSGEKIQEALLSARAKGRVELLHVSDDFTLMIDYAHNAMALKSLLSALRVYKPRRLICVFGCGGNRDRNRRFDMGETSGLMSDYTIITSDNPRFEEPEAIIEDIRSGIEKTDGAYTAIIDRKEAIRYAIQHGEPGDIIIIAGKGHEDYQEIKGVKYPMDDRVLVREILEEDALR
ncbi:MAG: UDP-N-acetylmuramoyl-L-alanyl-D-glutamate--2,6-diaminopimelate ligase [Lachnospiraceae bacterium]|nr:UDP-N-acetylmuramoyl-L-alanyl-D-glutamate--2,6-diaminopimelate ligase [Lachnospiraceae bacterium]